MCGVRLAGTSAIWSIADNTRPGYRLTDELVWLTRNWSRLPEMLFPTHFHGFPHIWDSATNRTVALMSNQDEPLGGVKCINGMLSFNLNSRSNYTYTGSFTAKAL